MKRPSRIAVFLPLRSPQRGYDPRSQLDNALPPARMSATSLRNANARGNARKPTNRVYRIAVIPGDGIGKETVPEGVRVLEAAAKKFGFELRNDDFDFASYDYYEKHQRMMPEDWKEKIGGHDAIFFGAVGWPAKIPDHISLWGSLILFRREFDQYVNLRPVRLMPGVPSPLANRKPGDIDFWVVRENTEGEYSAIGGRMFGGTEREVVVQETVMSRIGVDRVLKFAFELARKTPKKHLTSATKSNGIAITMPYWDERVEEMAKNFPRRQMGQISHRYSLGAVRAQARTSSTSSWRRTCSATFSPISVRPAPAPSASRRPAISIRSANFLRCSSRCTARRRISPGRASPIRSARSGRAR